MRRDSDALPVPRRLTRRAPLHGPDDELAPKPRSHPKTLNIVQGAFRRSPTSYGWMARAAISLLVLLLAPRGAYSFNDPWVSLKLWMLLGWAGIWGLTISSVWRPTSGARVGSPVLVRSGITASLLLASAIWLATGGTSWFAVLAASMTTLAVAVFVSSLE
jgi:hypothetical protein